MTDGAARRVDKPWGHELIWAQTEQYVGKILVIEAGRRLSLQKHVLKDESILVREGRLKLSLEGDDGVVRDEILGPRLQAGVEGGFPTPQETAIDIYNIQP